MKLPNNKISPIIVSGSHRSGTTWAGKMIALSPKVRYIHEPFNIGEHKDAPFENWFEYIDPKGAPNRLAGSYINEYTGWTFSAVKRDARRGIRQFFSNTRKKILSRPLIKDPIAFYSLPWLFNQFQADIIILVRHPAAFIASLKVKGWEFDFNNYLRQEKLMQDVLFLYRDQIEKLANKKHDIIDQGILLWNTIYYTVSQYKTSYPGWQFYRHEDISRDPISSFKKMYESLNLQFSEQIENEITKYCTNEKSSDQLIRNSRENIHKWKDRLTEKEISRIKEGTEDIYKIFYSEDEWI